MAENYRRAIDEAKGDIDSIILKMEQLDKQILETNRRAISLAGSLRASGFSEINKTVQQEIELFQKMNIELEKQSGLLGKLTEAQKRVAAAREEQLRKQQEKANRTQREIETERVLRKEELLHAQATLKVGGAYARLVARMKIAKKAYQDAIAGGKATRQELKKLEAEYSRLIAKVNAANQATARFGRGSMRGMIRGLRNLAGAFGFAGAAFIAADLVRKSFNLIKRLQSLNFALKTVTKTQYEFARAQNFVSEISNKFGGDILAVTERYTKFLAAADQSAVSLEDTEKIFASVTKASGVLGLKTDELTGVYLALEQMMSKGKVTTEELRRQLGERLPGAFGIMADALGVSIPKLDEMLKKGQVMSSEVLPKFADELIRAYGLDKIQNVETLEAATRRLNNAFVEMVGLFTEGSFSDSLMAVFNGIAQAVQFINKGLEYLAPTLEKLGNTVDYNVKAWKAFLMEMDPTGQTLEMIGNIIQAIIYGPWLLFNQFLELSTRLAVGLHGALRGLVQVINETDWTDRFLNPVGYMTQLLSSMSKGFNDAQTEFEKFHEAFLKQKQIDEYNNVLQKTATTMVMLSKARGGAMTIEIAENELRGKSLESIKAYYNELRKQLAETKKLTDDKGDGDEDPLYGTEEHWKKVISDLTELRNKSADTQDYWDMITYQIETAQAALAMLKGEFDPEDLFFIPDNPQEAFDFFEEILEKQKEIAMNDDFKSVKIDVILDDLAKDGVMSIEYLNEKWAEHFDKSEEGAEDFYDKMKEMQDDYQNHLTNTIKQASEAFGDFYDVDMTKFKFLIDGKEDKLTEWAAAGKEVVYGVTEAALRGYDVEMQEAIRSRDIILNNELATEQDKEEARRKFREEEAKIRTRQAKAERKATLIRIAADTAQGIVSALAQIPKFDFGITAGAFAAFIAATGAAQAALVAAQPIPKFAGGHLSGSHEGPALINDANRGDYQEVLQRHGGGIEVYKDRNQLVDMKKGDKVYKSMSEFARHNNISEHLLISMLNGNQDLSLATASREMVSEVSLMRRDMKTTWKEMRNMAKRPINVRVSAKVEQPETRQYV